MAQIVSFALPALVAALLAYVLSPVASRLASRVGAIDLPGERKIHLTAIPRLGGLAVVVSIGLVLTAMSWVSNGLWQLPVHLLLPLGLGVAPIFAVSLVDDVRPVDARVKLAAHVSGAVIAVTLGISLDATVHLFGEPIHIGVMALPLSVLWLVGVTNAFNIIDGLDGLSAGLALISAAGMTALFLLVGETEMARIVLVLAGALAGFLPHNVHPARMFLGDSGATAIGFCLAAFSLKGGSTLSSGFAALLPVFILGLPIADTLITMARRTVRRLESHAGGMFVPDRDHLHHRLLALGIDHGRAVLILYGLGLVLAAAAFTSVFLNARQAGLFVAALIIAGFVGLHRLEYDEFAFLKRGTVLRMYEVPAVKRGMFVVFVDIVLAFVSTYVAMALKADAWAPSGGRSTLLDLGTVLAPVTILLFWILGMYRGSWRVAGLHDLMGAWRAVSAAAIAGGIAVTFLSNGSYPASMFVIYGMVSLTLTTLTRASYVVLETTRLRASHRGVPVLVYGAGSSGAAAVRELFRDPSSGLRPVGFIDDDPAMRGRLVSGLPVLGTEREIDSILARHAAHAVLITTEKVAPDRLSRVVEGCSRAGKGVFRLSVQVERLVDGDKPSLLLDRLSPSPEMLRRTEARMPGPEPAGDACPDCSERSLQRSKARSLYERFRKSHTSKRLFRCPACGWRGWITPFDTSGPLAETVIGADTLDLSSIDAHLRDSTLQETSVKL